MYYIFTLGFPLSFCNLTIFSIDNQGHAAYSLGISGRLSFLHIFSLVGMEIRSGDINFLSKFWYKCMKSFLLKKLRPTIFIFKEKQCAEFTYKVSLHFLRIFSSIYYIYQSQLKRQDFIIAKSAVRTRTSKHFELLRKTTSSVVTRISSHFNKGFLHVS